MLMIEQLKKEIEIIKNNLAALPKNNKTNIKKYNDYINEVYTEYNSLFTKVDEEIKERFYSFFPSANYGRLRNIKLERHRQLKQHGRVTKIRCRCK